MNKIKNFLIKYSDFILVLILLTIISHVITLNVMHWRHKKCLEQVEINQQDILNNQQELNTNLGTIEANQQVLFDKIRN